MAEQSAINYDQPPDAPACDVLAVSGRIACVLLALGAFMAPYSMISEAVGLKALRWGFHEVRSALCLTALALSAWSRCNSKGHAAALSTALVLMSVAQVPSISWAWYDYYCDFEVGLPAAALVLIGHGVWVWAMCLAFCKWRSSRRAGVRPEWAVAVPAIHLGVAAVIGLLCSFVYVACVCRQLKELVLAG